MIGEGTIRGDSTADDLGERVRLDDVQALEGRHDSRFGRSERRRHGSDPDVVAALGGELDEVPTEDSQCSLTARRHELAVGLEARRRLIAGFPDRGVEAGIAEPLDELPPDRDLDLDDLRTGSDDVPGRHQRTGDLQVADRGPEPRTSRLAEDGQQFAAGGPVGIDPIDRRGGKPASLLLG